MSPFQHGEVFVTDDGAETDLDLGHYERFIDLNLTRESTVTTGQIYTEVLQRERRGDFLGGTIQIVPHITRAICERILLVAKISQAQIVLGEIGGTVGDIEGEPFLEAIRLLRYQLGANNTLFLHLTLLPFLEASGELKTKPTQASVRELRRIGIAPDLILARADRPIEKNLLEKISRFCDVAPQAVIPAPTVQSIYEVPLNLAKAGLTEILTQKLKLPKRPPRLNAWRKLVTTIKKPKKTLQIACVGKYTNLDDAYLSVNEALKAAAFKYQYQPKIVWVTADKLKKATSSEWQKLREAAGILVPGGFGERGIEGKVLAARFAREQQKPYFGLCLGLQILIIEFARNVLGWPQANSEEFDSKTPKPVIHFLPEQRGLNAKGGTMRLGRYACALEQNSLAFKLYQRKLIHERHRHRYEFNNDFKADFEQAGLKITGLNPQQNLAEICELKGHPFMLGCQFHPEFLSRPTKPHPLFLGFIEQALKGKNPDSPNS